MSTEQVLRLAYLQKQWEYIDFVRNTYATNFSVRLKELNKTRLRPTSNYEDVYQPKEDISLEVNPRLKGMYHKLMLKYHPDKLINMNEEEYKRAHLLSVYINEKYREQDLTALESLLNDENFVMSDDNISSQIEDYEGKINSLINTAFWQWNVSKEENKEYIESMYITEEEYFKLLTEENEKLKKDNENLRSFLETERHFLIGKIKSCLDVFQDDRFQSITNEARSLIESTDVSYTQLSELHLNLENVINRERLISNIKTDLGKINKLFVDIEQMRLNSQSEEPFDSSVYQEKIKHINPEKEDVSTDELKSFSSLLTEILRELDNKYWFYRKIWFKID